jgi:2-hydroxy-3-oxopropionate reductase
MNSRIGVAFLGLGKMGEPMAARILAAGHPLTVWNRSVDKTRGLAEKGARVAHSAAEAVGGADAAILMLADGPAVTEVLVNGGVAKALRKGAIVADMSSIPPAVAREHANLLGSRGVHHLDAPVSGGTTGAANGTLAIMVGGDSAAFESARAVFEVMGRPTLIGPSGSGQLAKLANQAIVGITIGAVAEALLLAAAGGADPAKVRDALRGGFADSTILKLHGERMLERAWNPGGRVRTQVKDLRTILAEAATLGLQLPLAGKVTELFEAGVQRGFGDYDHSALLLELERRNPGKRVGTRPDQAPVPER